MTKTSLSDMPLDLDALEALEKKATRGPWAVGLGGTHINFPKKKLPDEYDYALTAAARNALPELIRLARIGQRVERDAKRPDPMSQYLNEGDGVYRP